MMYPSLPAFDSLDEVQKWLLGALVRDGETVSPRGMLTKELLAVGFLLRNPRARCITNVARRFSLPLALGEFAWHMRADNEVGALAYYATRWREFADEQARITGSCYGHKIFVAQNGIESQWRRMLQLLDADRSSRRAVLTFWDDSVLSSGAVDAPCTSTIHFLIRDSRLHAVVTMRSNDSIWGVPYDTFLFTMLQEYLACELGLELGDYAHFANSMHLYQRHFTLAERVIAGEATAFTMPHMSGISSLTAFLETEKAIRLRQPMELDALPAYWRSLAMVLDSYAGGTAPASDSDDLVGYEPFLRRRRAIREAVA